MISHRKSPIAQDIVALARQIADTGPKFFPTGPTGKREAAAGKRNARTETAEGSEEDKRPFWRSLAQFGPSTSGAK
jgi:hypothetical protein